MIYLYNLPSETMFWQIKRVARLGPASEQLALPLNGSKCAEMTLCARNDVLLLDGVEFAYRPPSRWTKTHPLREARAKMRRSQRRRRPAGGPPARAGQLV